MVYIYLIWDQCLFDGWLAFDNSIQCLGSCIFANRLHLRIVVLYCIFLAPQGAFWTASDGGGGVGEIEFYKPKNNIKDNISCLYLLLVLSNINDGAFM